MYYRGDFKKYCIKEKTESNFRGEKPAFYIHLLTLRAAEYSLIKALPEVQEATLQLSTAGIFCTGVWKRNHSYLCFEKIVRLREKRLFPTENLIQLINKKTSKQCFRLLNSLHEKIMEYFQRISSCQQDRQMLSVMQNPFAR